MGPKTNRLSSDGRKWTWELPGEGLTDRLVEGTLKHGGGSVTVWGCMSWDGIRYACRIDGRIDRDLCTKILEEELMLSIRYLHKTPSQVIFQQGNGPKHACKKTKDWFKTAAFKSYHGQHSLQTSIQLIASDSTSKGGFEGTPHYIGGYWNCGRGQIRSGRPFPSQFAWT